MRGFGILIIAIILSSFLVVGEEVSIIASQESGNAPLTVEFSVQSSQSIDSSAWDFDNDGIIDDNEAMPQHTYDKEGIYTANVTIKIAENELNAVKEINVTNLVAVEENTSLVEPVSKPNINIVSYFPDVLTVGENYVTFIIANEGNEAIGDVSAKVIGMGIQHLSSTTITELIPNDQDSITVKINLLQEGNAVATAKIYGMNFPVNFSFTEQIKYNKDELQTRLDELKKRLQEQESIYYDKKSEGYPVSEVFENIKQAQKQLQDAQQQIFTEKLAEARVSLDLASLGIDDIVNNLAKVKKQKVTLMMWLKENALAITATIAALGTLGGILLKLKKHAVKVTEKAKEFATKKDTKSKKKPKKK